jgi:hypothetical protein
VTRALFTLNGALKQDGNIDRWIDALPSELAAITRAWFSYMRQCGADVRELMHDGCPTVCVEDVPFAYVGAYKDHVSVGFYAGAMLSDPGKLLEGTGKQMRHVKLRPDSPIDVSLLEALIDASYRDVVAKVGKAGNEKSWSNR